MQETISAIWRQVVAAAAAAAAAAATAAAAAAAAYLSASSTPLTGLATTPSRPLATPLTAPAARKRSTGSNQQDEDHHHHHRIKTQQQDPPPSLQAANASRPQRTVHPLLLRPLQRLLEQPPEAAQHRGADGARALQHAVADVGDVALRLGLSRLGRRAAVGQGGEVRERA